MSDPSNETMTDQGLPGPRLSEASAESGFCRRLWQIRSTTTIRPLFWETLRRMSPRNADRSSEQKGLMMDAGNGSLAGTVGLRFWTTKGKKDQHGFPVLVVGPKNPLSTLFNTWRSSTSSPRRETSGQLPMRLGAKFATSFSTREPRMPS